MNQNAPRGCAARGDEVYAEHTARARKCATSAHFILKKRACTKLACAPVLYDQIHGKKYKEE